MKELTVFFREGLTPEKCDVIVFYILRQLKVFTDRDCLKYKN